MTHERCETDDDFGECANCGGEGFVYGCSWDWQCDTYDEGEGTCLCTRRCEWCNPVQLTPAQQAEKDALRQVLADALKDAHNDPGSLPRRDRRCEARDYPGR